MLTRYLLRSALAGLTLSALCCLPVHAARKAAGQKADAGMTFYTMSQDAQGLTPEDMDDEFLQGLERYTVEQAQISAVGKKRARKRQSDGQVRIRSRSQYIEVNGKRLAVVYLRGPGQANQAIIHGLDGKTFSWLKCYRAGPQPISVESGPCAERIRAQFGARAPLRKGRR